MNAILVRMSQRWFENVRSGPKLIEELSRSGRPTDTGSNHIKVLIDEKPSFNSSRYCR